MEVKEREIRNNLILKVALDVPLYKLFDYQLNKKNSTKPSIGSRVLVPFGKQKKVGVIIDIVNRSSVAKSKLKECISILDENPIFEKKQLDFIHFASNYYQYPLGRVLYAAMPGNLRKGKSLTKFIDSIVITDNGKNVDLDNLKKRAPKQAALMSILMENHTLDSNGLSNIFPEWKKYSKRPIEKNWIKIEQIIEPHKDTQKLDKNTKGPALNSEQKKAILDVKKSSTFNTFLLDGVTGSGKTEIYLSLISDVIERGQDALILVPEIGLINQLNRRIEVRLGIKPSQYHSGLTEKERFITWKKIQESKTRIILGTRSAILAPFKNLGLIVVDEEHDISYKQQEGFRYSARDLAVMRAKNFNIPIILGSATPSLESFNQHVNNKYKYLTLKKRAGNAKMPSMHLIDLNKGHSEDGLSKLLIKSMNEHIENDGQILVFINRRGYAPTLICKTCNFIAECSRCDSRMTLYLSKKLLLCHHCNYKEKYKNSCIKCDSEMIALGQGSQRIEDSLKKHFPNEQILRIDSDSTQQKNSLDEALEKAKAGKAKILVGTQMLSKGHHFSSLSLVVVVNADQGLFSNDFRGSERLAQNIIQVAGRAGREKKKGQVIIQTEYPDHPFWPLLFQGGYKEIVEMTLMDRKSANWPPYSFIVLIRAQSHRKKYTWSFLEEAKKILISQKPNFSILGPVSAPMEKKASHYRGQLLLQSEGRKSLNQTLKMFIDEIERKKFIRRVKWSIDVDPIELF